MVIIIGAGPSGISLAIMLQQRGFSVVTIDKRRFPREKLCGGVLTSKSCRFLNALFIGNNVQIQEILGPKIQRINIITKKRTMKFLKRRNPYHVIDRKKFDHGMVEYYKGIGGILYEGCSILKYNYKNSTLVLSNGITLSYSYLVGADGVYSSIRRYVDSDYYANGICYQNKVEDELLALDKDTIYLFYDLYKYGYGWIFPRVDGFIFGIGGQTDTNKQLSEYNRLAATLNIPNVYKTMHLPFGHYVKQPIRNNVLLVGDAAGLANPITGEGIYYAFLSAKYAYRCVTAQKSRRFLIKIKLLHIRIKLLCLLRPLYYNGIFQKVYFPIVWKRLRYKQ